MRRSTRFLVGCALALAASLPAAAQTAAPEPAPATEVMLLRLADGGALWGRIHGHDAERLAFQRLDNGGIVRMPWKQLEPRQAGQLLEDFGYVDHTGEELMVDADRLELDDGNEVIGRIVSRTENEIYVKTADRLLPVPKRRIAGAVTSVVVPALDVFTRDELYRAEAEKLDPQSAKSQVDLAKHCERILDFAHALEHYKAAQLLEPGFGGGQLPPTLARVQQKAANQEQLDFLYGVDSMKARGYFDKATKALDAFAQKWPDSNLRSDVERKRKQIEKARLAALRALVRGQWYKWVERLTTQEARKEGGTLEAALEYTAEKLREDVLAAVTKDAQRSIGASVKPEEIKQIWDERKFEQYKRASYGQGTWLLGEAAALKEYGDEQEKPKEKPKSGAEAEREKMEAKIKRYMENQRTVGKKKAAQSEEQDEESEQEKFWRTWTSYYRSQWLIAHYAENGGDLRIVKEELSNCPDCGGTGTREMINTGSARSNPQGAQPGQSENSAGLVMVDCPLCHRIGRIRRVRYW